VSVWMCTDCGKVKVDGQWVHMTIQADMIVRCPDCQVRLEASWERKWREADEKLLADRERGYPEADAGEDVFRGFRRLE
jgi:DNA-directed RNA polymerase subunit RPC12/RpoP